MVRSGKVRYGKVRYGKVRYGKERYVSVRFGTLRYGTVLDEYGAPTVSYLVNQAVIMKVLMISLCVFIAFGIDYGYVVKFSENQIFDQFFHFLNFVFDIP
jgi:hypothetical protein